MNHLLPALARHVAQRLQLRAQARSWTEFSEYELVRCLDAIFSGLGYQVFPEWKVQGRRIDLRAISPLAGDNEPEVYVEAKFIWDVGDNRLNTIRFHEGREILKDFSSIPGCEEGSARHLVVWLVQSRVREEVCAGPKAKTLRLGDVVAHVEREHAELLGEPVVLDANELWPEPLDYRYLHLYLWQPRRALNSAPLDPAPKLTEPKHDAPVSQRKKTGDLAEEAVRERLRELGLEAEKPWTLPGGPSRDEGVDLEVWGKDAPNRKISVQVKGRGPEQSDGNYRWFQVHTTEREIQRAGAEGYSPADAWKKKAQLSEFFILASLGLGEFWVFPTTEILEIVEFSRAKHGNRSGFKSGKHVEINLEVKHQGKRLTELYAHRRGNFLPLLELLGVAAGGTPRLV